VDEPEVPELAPLVEVGDARRAELDRELPERVDRAVERYARQERVKLGEEPLRPPLIEDRARERDEPALVLLARREPARPDLGLARGLHEVALEALAKRRLVARLEGPRAEERLVDEELLRRVGHDVPVEAHAAGLVPAAPAERALAPVEGDLGEDVDPRLHVL